MSEAPPVIPDKAPPEAGGFWRVDIEDDLRNNVLGLLRPAKNSLETFLADGFLLLHTLKWPIQKRTGMANAIAHAASAHILEEIRLVQPRAILAMGNFAKEACRELADDKELHQDGFETPRFNSRWGVETLRGKPYFIWRDGRQLSIAVTLLPVNRNLSDRQNRQWFREDVLRFLEQHPLTDTVDPRGRR